MKLSDGMRDIVNHLARGVDLIGPVTVTRATGTSPRDWGFADGRRASKISVDALAARGLIRIVERNGRRRAELTP